MLKKLKEHGNKHYQFYEDYNEFQNRCRETDPAGYDVMFIDDLQGEIETMSSKEDEVHDELRNEISI